MLLCVSCCCGGCLARPPSLFFFGLVCASFMCPDCLSAHRLCLLFRRVCPSSWHWLASTFQPDQSLSAASSGYLSTLGDLHQGYTPVCSQRLAVNHRDNESLPVVRVSGQRIAARSLVVARRSSRLVSAFFVGRSRCRLFPEHSRTPSIPPPAPRLCVFSPLSTLTL